MTWVSVVGTGMSTVSFMIGSVCADHVVARAAMCLAAVLAGAATALGIVVSLGGVH